MNRREDPFAAPEVWSPGVVGSSREDGGGPGGIVWAAAMPEAEIATHHFETKQTADGFELMGVTSPTPLATR